MQNGKVHGRASIAMKHARKREREREGERGRERERERGGEGEGEGERKRSGFVQLNIDTNDKISHDVISTLAGLQQ